MLLAGHETTSAATTWALWELAKPQHLSILQRLQAELATATSDQPSMDELNAFPYLDAVIRENMRKNSPADSVMRAADKDTVIPLSQPFTDRKGVVHHELR